MTWSNLVSFIISGLLDLEYGLPDKDLDVMMTNGSRKGCYLATEYYIEIFGRQGTIRYYPVHRI
jgi:hypothetical protein